MSQVIIYSQENGKVAVCYPTGEVPIDEVLTKDCPEGAIIVDANVIPQDHTFFNAWELNNSTVTVNINKAKEITKERLRVERKPLLEAQDVAFQRALESNADTSAIVAEKQRLRDITNQVDTMTTVEELKGASL
jgi:hypothetical protein